MLGAKATCSWCKPGEKCEKSEGCWAIWPSLIFSGTYKQCVCVCGCVYSPMFISYTHALRKTITCGERYKELIHFTASPSKKKKNLESPHYLGLWILCNVHGLIFLPFHFQMSLCQHLIPHLLLFCWMLISRLFDIYVVRSWPKAYRSQWEAFYWP